MTALPIKGLQQSFKAVERLQTALNYSVYKTKSQESERKKLEQGLKKVPRNR